MGDAHLAALGGHSWSQGAAELGWEWKSCARPHLPKLQSCADYF